MIYTVTLNPAIDYVVSTRGIYIGEQNIYQSEQYGAGGKGVNVSRMLTALGVENTALGFVRGFSGEEILRLLREEGCETDFIRIPSGHSRINIKICEEGGKETDINAIGPPLPDGAREMILQKLKDIKNGDILVLAGSIPDEKNEGIYAEILEEISGTGALCVVDAVGRALTETLKYRPFLIKPNEEELGFLFQTEIRGRADALEHAHALQDRGARNVVVSMGERGALLLLEDGTDHFFEAVSGKMISPVGAGDSMIAGILYGLSETGDILSAMQWGVCAGAATAFTKGIATAKEVEDIYKAVQGGDC